MGDLIALCPECGLRAKVIGNQATLLADKDRCKHRQNPLNCPVFDPLIFKLLMLASRTIDGP
jgi:hypothetical protein